VAIPSKASSSGTVNSITSDAHALYQDSVQHGGVYNRAFIVLRIVVCRFSLTPIVGALLQIDTTSTYLVPRDQCSSQTGTLTLLS
jgi:hypothetical protein